MLTATELSSERIPWDDLETLGLLLGVSVGSWLLAAIVLGDYRGREPSSDNTFVEFVLGPSFIALLDATVTWWEAVFNY